MTLRELKVILNHPDLDEDSEVLVESSYNLFSIERVKHNLNTAEIVLERKNNG